jgi:hypothetical protein
MRMARDAGTSHIGDKRAIRNAGMDHAFRGAEERRAAERFLGASANGLCVKKGERYRLKA